MNYNRAIAICMLCGLVLVLVPVINTTNETLSWTTPQGGVIPSSSATMGLLAENNFTRLVAWNNANGSEISQTIANTSENPERTGGSILDTVIATDSRGNALAMWTQYVGNHTWNIRSCYYNNGTGWGEPTIVQSGPTAFGPKVGFDANGNAMAIFQVKIGDSNNSNGPYDPAHPVENYYNIFACRFVVGHGWGEIQKVQDGMEDLEYYAYQLAVSSNGQAVVIWTQIEGRNNAAPTSNLSVCINHYSPALGWGSAQQLYSGYANDIYPQVAIDNNGKCVATWGRNYQDTEALKPGQYVNTGANVANTNFYQIYATYSQNGSIWFDSQVIQHGDGQVLMFSSSNLLVINQNNAATAYWSVDGGSYNACQISLESKSIYSAAGMVLMATIVGSIILLLTVILVTLRKK